MSHLPVLDVCIHWCMHVFVCAARVDRWMYVHGDARMCVLMLVCMDALVCVEVACVCILVRLRMPGCIYVCADARMCLWYMCMCAYMRRA